MGIHLIDEHETPEWVKTLCYVILTSMLCGAIGWTQGVKHTEDHYIESYILVPR